MLNNAITEMKNSLEGFSSIYEQTKESANLKISTLKLSRLRSRKKTE